LGAREGGNTTGGNTTDLDALGVMVGLEIHQQLATGKKLFCSCTPGEPAEHPIVFRRRLRSASGELGGHDPAALFERSKDRTVTYYAELGSSCLVEQDEEPPHELDPDARGTALIIASALKSRIYTELHPMRKTVVDGSNTTGFQRTILISEGGSFEVPNEDYEKPSTIGIQSVCLEEDAAKILDDAGSGTRGYGLERLGVPLVEIATEPFTIIDNNARMVALTLGRILRSTRMVTRGLGSIRQDVNISIAGGGNTVVEIKGVQQLYQLEEVIRYEAQRQHGLLAIAKRLQKSRWRENHDPDLDIADVTDLLAQSKSKIIQKAVSRGDTITTVVFRGAGGIFGYSPYKDVRLGRDIAELVRRFGVGGIFHTDELPAYGITEQDLAGITERLNTLAHDDASLILAAPPAKTDVIIDHIIKRMTHITDARIPADTRLATPDGKTSFLRPRPGAARMYPETDVPTITITQDELMRAQNGVPKPWDKSILDLQSKFNINAQLAEQLWDSAHLGLFERITSELSNIRPTLVASVLCYTITALERQKGLDSGLLNDDMVAEVFGLLDEGKIAKEAVEMILQEIMSGRASTVGEAVAPILSTKDSDSLEEIIDRIIHDNIDVVRKKGERASGPLMGIIMKEMRGRASGQAINAALVRGIKAALKD